MRITVVCLLSALLLFAVPGYAQYLSGEQEISQSLATTSSALSKSKSIPLSAKYKQTLLRLKRALKKRHKTSSSGTPVIKSFSPSSPADFAAMTPNESGQYKFSISGSNFSKDMTLLAVYVSSNRRVSVPFKYVSSKRIDFKSSSAFEAIVKFTLLKSLGYVVLESNTKSYEFTDSSTQSKGDEGTPTPTPTPTTTPGSGSGTPPPPPNPSPSATPTANATSTPAATATSTPTPQPTPIVSSPGDHVATLETEANGASKFVLHGVIPIPRNKIRESGINAGQSFLAVEDAGGTLIPAQIEKVTKNAGSSLGDADPDIAEVEVIAQVNIKSGQTRPQYRVFEASNSQPARPSSGYNARSILYSPPFQSEGTVNALFDAPGKLVLRAHDIFGNSYSADLTDQIEGLPKILKYGAHQVQVRTFNIMKPDVVVGGASGTYPRLFGVHTYFTLSKETKALKLDIKIGNTLSGLNSAQTDDNYLKEFYYQDLTLEVGASDWDIKHLFGSMYSGASYNSSGKTMMPLVVPMPGNKPHYMPPLKHLLLRSAIFPNISGASADADLLVLEKGISFAVRGTSANNPSLELFSYFNAGLRSYLPQGTYIPTLTHISGGLPAVRSYFQQSLTKYNNLISQEKCNAIYKVVQGVGSYQCDYPVSCGLNPQDPNDPNDHICGPISAWGVTYGGMTSGTETSKVEGAMVAASASLEGYRWLLLQHKERTQRNDQFHKRNGEVVSLSDIEQNSACGVITPIDYFNKLNTNQMDPFGVNQAPLSMSTYAAANGLQPDYEFFWNPANPTNYDNEDGQHSVRYQRTNDALTWLGNDSVAKDGTLAAAGIAMFQHPFRPVKCNGTTPVYDSSDVYGLAPSTPGIGIDIGREEAHMWTTLVSGFAVGDAAFRNYIRPAYFDYLVDNVFSVAQIPSLGYLTHTFNPGKDSPVGRCWTVRVNEEGFLHITNLAIRRRVYEGANAARSNTLQGIVTNQVYANLTSQLAWADGSGTNVPSWYRTRFRVPIAAEFQPAAIFTSWDSVPLDCQNDSNNIGASFGEYLFGFSQVREWTGDPSISQAASDHLSHASTSPLLIKLQTINLSTLESGIHISLLACAQQGKC